MADPLAQALARWADRLAPATRDRLSTYDLHALYDRMGRAHHVGGAVEAWASQLGPSTHAALSHFDLQALTACVVAVRSEGPPVPESASAALRPARTARLDPTGLGPPSRPEYARGGAFTGDSCNACGSLALVRSGACTTCQDCGTTSGCS